MQIVLNFSFFPFFLLSYLHISVENMDATKIDFHNPLGERQLEQHLMSSSKRLCSAAGKCFDPPFQMAI